MTFEKLFKPVFDDGNMLWSYCWKHHDKHRPNLSLTYTGTYAGRWKCWACGVTGKISKQTLYQICNQHNPIFSKKIQPKHKNPFEIWATNRTYLSKCPQPDETLGIVGSARPRILNVLEKLRAAWDGKSLLFPLRSSQMYVMGIHRRPAKTNIKGSCLGIYAAQPLYMNYNEPVFITEGLTDTIVTMLIGYIVIGKFSALTCNKIIKDLTKPYRCDIIIISQNDEIGIQGAEKTASVLKDQKSKVVIVPKLNGIKDIKDAYNEWGEEKTKQWFNSII